MMIRIQEERDGEVWDGICISNDQKQGSAPAVS